LILAVRLQCEKFFGSFLFRTMTTEMEPCNVFRAGLPEMFAKALFNGNVCCFFICKPLYMEVILTATVILQILVNLIDILDTTIEF
jgi:hypothetical protein